MLSDEEWSCRLYCAIKPDLIQDRYDQLGYGIGQHESESSGCRDKRYQFVGTVLA
jgi:hypothetical protein